MCSHFFDFFCFVHIILEGVFVSGIIQNVSRIAECYFRQLVAFQDFIQSYVNALEPVEGVEDAEYVDSCGSRFTDEFADHIVRIVLVSYGICASE